MNKSLIVFLIFLPLILMITISFMGRVVGEDEVVGVSAITKTQMLIDEEGDDGYVVLIVDDTYALDSFYEIAPANALDKGISIMFSSNVNADFDSKEYFSYNSITNKLKVLKSTSAGEQIKITIETNSGFKSISFNAIVKQEGLFFEKDDADKSYSVGDTINLLVRVRGINAGLAKISIDGDAVSLNDTPNTISCYLTMSSNKETLSFTAINKGKSTIEITYLYDDGDKPDMADSKLTDSIIIYVE